jgi:plasmid maintenance system antidote protein VapI
MFFGLPAQVWLDLQHDYNLRPARSEDLAKIKPFRAPYDRAFSPRMAARY